LKSNIKKRNVKSIHIIFILSIWGLFSCQEETAMPKVKYAQEAVSIPMAHPEERGARTFLCQEEWKVDGAKQNQWENWSTRKMRKAVPGFQEMESISFLAGQKIWVITNLANGIFSSSKPNICIWRKSLNKKPCLHE
jgi:hypothetical protein